MNGFEASFEIRKARLYKALVTEYIFGTPDSSGNSRTFGHQDWTPTKKWDGAYGFRISPDPSTEVPRVAPRVAQAQFDFTLGQQELAPANSSAAGQQELAPANSSAAGQQELAPANSSAAVRKPISASHMKASPPKMACLSTSNRKAKKELVSTIVQPLPTPIRSENNGGVVVAAGTVGALIFALWWCNRGR